MACSRLLALSYIINTKDANFLTKYGVEYYNDYDVDKKTQKIVPLDGYAPEYNAILDHYKKYGVIPTIMELMTVLPKDSPLFVNFENTTDSPAEYYGKKLVEEYKYTQVVLIENSTRQLICSDAIKGIEVLYRQLGELQKHTSNTTTGFDTTKQKLRANFVKSLTNPMSVYSTGLDKLDNLLDGGFRSTEELVVIFARTNVGKSWWSLKFALEMWKQGLNIGFFSPEMSKDIVCNRLLTLNSHVSNRSLNKPYGGDLTEADYDYLLSELPTNGGMHIVDISDFDDRVTVAKLENFVRANKLNALFLDGISYIAADDDRVATWESQGNITRQLMSMSVKLSIPIIVVAQANREAVKKDKDGNALTDVPTLNTIASSDQIVQHATRVIGIGRGTDDGKTKDKNLYTLGVIKNRYGDNNTEVKYRFMIDEGKFIDADIFKDATDFYTIPTYRHDNFLI